MKFLPRCLPATWQNDIANQMMASKCVGKSLLTLLCEVCITFGSGLLTLSLMVWVITDVLPVWEDLRCLHLHHANEDKWDCTHYNPHVIDLLNFKTLSLITMLKKSKEGVGNTLNLP